ncbi:MAG TPA: EVE domain-containing protein [Deltaproteobacteria bacterium]|nr:EVE domain-containing protein [Candidatus Binatota bacterium]HIL13214.1 EVE domain-containing protein [Deltaproteobacteria bacterium]
MNYWLAKSEPKKYSWEDFVSEGRDYWDGVRNYQARNNLSAMKIGDRVLFYHSVTGKEVVGIAEIVREAYQDPTTDDERWVAVDMVPVEKLTQPVTLADIKAEPTLAELALVKQSRLSVVPLLASEYRKILSLAKP